MIRSFAALLWMACGAEQVLVPTRNLDRPTAVAFVCMKIDAEGAAYEPARAADCVAQASDTRALYGFVANSTRGEVALVQVTAGELIDLEPVAPAFQFISVGDLPHDIAASSDGCFAVASNYGSCDLGILDTTQVVRRESSARVSRTALGSRPHSLAMRPTSFESCALDSPYQAYVTFPGCGLVARVDIATGRFIEALRLGPKGPEMVDDPECPQECQGEPALQGTAQPTGLALSDDGSLLVVASEAAPYVAWASLDVDTGEFVTFGQIAIEGAEGLRRVSVSPATDGGQFVYAVATDGTVRVLSLSLNRECETNVDPRALPELVDPTVGQCFPVGDPAYPRRALARTPGIELPGDIAADVSFATIHCCAEPDGDTCPADADRKVCGDTVEEGASLATIFFDGVYAFVASTRGLVYTVDVQDEFNSARTTEGLRAGALPHALRPLAARGDQDCALPKDSHTDFRWPMPTVSSVAIGYGEEAPETDDVEFPGLLDLTSCPRTCTETEEGGCVDACGDECAGEDDFGVTFPDVRAPETETVDVAFEGALPGSARATGRVGTCDNAPCISDVGAAFCTLGVETGDILQLRGCTADRDCDTLIEVCAFDTRAPVGVGGMCVARNYEEKQLEACERLMRSRREYQVTDAWQNHLAVDVLPVKLHCEEELSCGACLDAAETNDCIRTCVKDSDCPGTVCEDVGADRICVAAPPLLDTCYTSIARYQIRTGNAFRVLLGQDLEFFHRVVPNDEGRCVVDASKSALRTSRISLDPPPCEEPAGPTPNPCVDQSRSLERYIYFANPRYSFALRRVDRTPVRTPEATFFLRFSVEQPLTALATASGAFQAVRIVRGPDDFQYVVDSGDTVPAGGVRGQLLRWDPLRAALDNDFLVR